MNGVELAMGMVSMVPGCKVVLFSGHARSVDLMRAYDAGYDFPLMAKPMHPSEMLGQVAKSLSSCADGGRLRSCADGGRLRSCADGKRLRVVGA
jgi:DNA-binding NtrC family response regulator